MQTANIIVDNGGDNGNQVPKYGVTPAEIAVLIAIHGESAVHDIEPTGEIERTNREERTRVAELYGHAKDHEDRSIVATLFPGAAARVFETIEELGLPEEFFKPTARSKAAADPLDHDGDGKKGGSKTKAKAKAKAPEPEAEPTAPEPVVAASDDEAKDEVEDMPDADKDMFN